MAPVSWQWSITTLPTFPQHSQAAGWIACLLRCACCVLLTLRQLLHSLLLYILETVEQVMSKTPVCPQRLQSMLYSISTAEDSGALPHPTIRCRIVKYTWFVCERRSGPVMVLACVEK